MALKLCLTHIQAMQAHAERSYPYECCGLILGTLGVGDRASSGNCDAANKVLAEVKAIENTWNEQVAHDLQDETSLTATQRYWIAPEAMLEAMHDARSRQLDVIGIYHSHPDSPAVPSECDRRLAWQQYSYIILSVIHRKVADIQSWQLNESRQFDQESLIMTASFPP